MFIGREWRGGGGCTAGASIAVDCCSTGKMAAVASASSDACLTLVEMNLFKELTHLSLRLRKASDDTLKLHLAKQLAGLQVR